MPKDSQVDNKRARIKKSNGQKPLTSEEKTNSNNAKKQSIQHNDV